MKKVSACAFLAFVLSLSVISCSKGSAEEDEDDEPDVVMGDVTFYITKAPSCESVRVTLQTEDLQRSLHSYISKNSLTAGTPECGMTSGFTFRNVAYGKYKFTASCGTRTLNGSFTVNKTCTLQSLD